MKEIFCGPSFGQFGSLSLHPSDSSLPQRSTRSFRFAMGPTNNSTFDIRSAKDSKPKISKNCIYSFIDHFFNRAGDELQRRDNSDTGDYLVHEVNFCGLFLK